MKKIKNLLLLAVAAMTLSGCDLFPGGGKEEEEIDPNLYTLELRVNMQDAEFQDIGLEYEPMDEEEMDSYVEEYGSKGITKENLQKVGTFENGKYYFMSQDGFFLKAPMVVGYEMVGWYDGDTRIDGGIDYTCDGKTDYMVNMPGKNTVLEARYAPINYKFRLSSEYEGNVVSDGMKEWNITMGDYVLNNPSLEGKTFKQWDFHGYYFNHAEGLVNVNQGEQLDPRCYKTIEDVKKIDKDFLLQLGDVAYGYCAELETDLVANFETNIHTVTINFPDNIEGVSFYVSLNHSDLFEGYHWIKDAIEAGVEGASNPLVFTCKYDSDVEIYFNLVDDSYSFDGFFINGSQTPATKSSTYSFKVKDNTSIEIKVSANA